MEPLTQVVGKVIQVAGPALASGAKSLAITFAPTARTSGTIRFQRLRLVEE